MNYQAFIFDLDGTLINSLEDIADAMNKTLMAFGFPSHTYADYKYFVGNGLRNMVLRALPDSAKQNKQMVNLCYEAMVSEYRTLLVNKTKLYPGIEEMLDVISATSFQMSVLSNKAENLTLEIADVLLKKWKFSVILGSSEKFPRKPEPDSALYIARKMNVLPERIIYVGDSNVDMKTACAAQMYAVGVTWGFRTRMELEEAGAQFIVESPEELVKMIEKQLPVKK